MFCVGFHRHRTHAPVHLVSLKYTYVSDLMYSISIYRLLGVVVPLIRVSLTKCIFETCTSILWWYRIYCVYVSRQGRWCCTMPTSVYTIKCMRLSFLNRIEHAPNRRCCCCLRILHLATRHLFNELKFIY